MAGDPDQNANPYAVSVESSFGHSTARRRTGPYYFLLGVVALLVAILQGVAQLRWHPISNQLLGLFGGYLVTTSILFPAIAFELFCRRTRRFENLFLSLLGSAIRIVLLFGVLLFFSVNLSFFCMTGKWMFTVQYPYDRTNIPAYALASGVLLATFLLVAYDALVSFSWNRKTRAETKR